VSRPIGVLLVSQDAELKRQITHALHRSGLSSGLLRSAACGREGLDLLATQRPRLVILDDDLSDTKALDLLRRLYCLGPKLLIVYLASCHTLELEREVRRLGVLYYTEKPPDPEVLKRILDTTFPAAGQRAQRCASSPAGAGTWVESGLFPYRQR
jgi:DNA-binding response OmpR family regulator